MKVTRHRAGAALHRTLQLLIAYNVGNSWRARTFFDRAELVVTVIRELAVFVDWAKVITSGCRELFVG